MRPLSKVSAAIQLCPSTHFHTSVRAELGSVVSLFAPPVYQMHAGIHAMEILLLFVSKV